VRVWEREQTGATFGSKVVDRIADYHFVRSLGAGNHGSYYLAEKPARLPVSDAQVVVKVMSGRTSDETFRRATKELKAFAAVQSPYLVRLFDAGQESGVFFYAMEHLPLGSLAEPAKPLSQAEVRRAVAHAAMAAHALHEAGLVHRDIQPANVLLHADGAKLSDLGLAQVIQPGVTMTGMGAVASVEYVDPALLQGGRASAATDIWSLGITLHRALTGKGVYGELPDSDPLLALRRVLSSKPELEPELDLPTADLVRACLDPDPASRPRTAAEVAERLTD
jgi:eukaryotic-like serine/threonine-protein kinase